MKENNSNTKENKSNKTSGLIASAVFLIFLIVVKSGFWLSILIGIVTYILFAFLILRKKRTHMVAEGITQEDLDSAIKEGEQKVWKIKGMTSKIMDMSMRKKVEQITDTASSIFKDIRKDPKDIKQAHKFISYYLETTKYIVAQYIDLANGDDYIDRREEMINKISNMLDSLNALFKKLKSKLKEDDLFELDMELKLLEQTIKSEGI